MFASPRIAGHRDVRRDDDRRSSAPPRVAFAVVPASLARARHRRHRVSFRIASGPAGCESPSVACPKNRSEERRGVSKHPQSRKFFVCQNSRLRFSERACARTKRVAKTRDATKWIQSSMKEMTVPQAFPSILTNADVDFSRTNRIAAHRAGGDAAAKAALAWALLHQHFLK